MWLYYILFYIIIINTVCNDVADVYKTEVYKLSNYRNSISEVIPKNIIDKKPSAEMSEDQYDSDTLPEYDLLDKIIKMYIELDYSSEKIIKSGIEKDIVFDKGMHHIRVTGIKILDNILYQILREDWIRLEKKNRDLCYNRLSGKWSVTRVCKFCVFSKLYNLPNFKQMI